MLSSTVTPSLSLSTSACFRSLLSGYRSSFIHDCTLFLCIFLIKDSSSVNALCFLFSFPLLFIFALHRNRLICAVRILRSNTISNTTTMNRTHFLLTLETIVFLFHLLSATSKPFSSLSTSTCSAIGVLVTKTRYINSLLLLLFINSRY